MSPRFGACCSLMLKEIKSRSCVWNVGGGAGSSVHRLSRILTTVQSNSVFTFKSAEVKLFDMFQWLTHDRGGGISFIVHESLCDHLTTTTTDFSFQHASFELAYLSINLCQHCLQLVCLYRPPSNRKNNLQNEVL